MAASITIGGVAMPEPKLNGLKISRNKIWSKNAGRGADGTMTGDIIGLKWKEHYSKYVCRRSYVSGIHLCRGEATVCRCHGKPD